MQAVTFGYMFVDAKPPLGIILESLAVPKLPSKDVNVAVGIVGAVRSKMRMPNPSSAPPVQSTPNASESPITLHLSQVSYYQRRRRLLRSVCVCMQPTSASAASCSHLLEIPRRPAAMMELIGCFALGAQVIMPHNLYLHSALVQSRCAPSGCVCTGIALELPSIS